MNVAAATKKILAIHKAPFINRRLVLMQHSQTRRHHIGQRHVTTPNISHCRIVVLALSPYPIKISSQFQQHRTWPTIIDCIVKILSDHRRARPTNISYRIRIYIQIIEILVGETIRNWGVKMKARREGPNWSLPAFFPSKKIPVRYNSFRADGQKPKKNIFSSDRKGHHTRGH